MINDFEHTTQKCQCCDKGSVGETDWTGATHERTCSECGGTGEVTFPPYEIKVDRHDGNGLLALGDWEHDRSLFNNRTIAHEALTAFADEYPTFDWVLIGTDGGAEIERLSYQGQREQGRNEMENTNELTVSTNWECGQRAYLKYLICHGGGEWHYGPIGPFTILAIVDGYAMCRGEETPFCALLSELKKTPEACTHDAVGETWNYETHD